MATRPDVGERWPSWSELETENVGLTFRARWWRLVDLASAPPNTGQAIFGSKFEQRHYAIACAEEEWTLEQARRTEAALPLGERPGFMALLEGAVIAAGRMRPDAERAARNHLRRRWGRAWLPRFETAPATKEAMAAWARARSKAPLIVKRVSPYWREDVVLTEDEAERLAPAFAEIVGWCAHTYITIEGSASDEKQALELGKAAVMETYRDADGDHLETCEVTAAGMALLEAGVSRKGYLEEVTVLGEFREPEFVDGEIYLAHVPGAPITSLIACSGSEAKALWDLEKLIPDESQGRCMIRVEWR